MNFNWLDVAIFTIFLVSVFSSVQRGFSREVIGLIAAFTGLVVGLWFYGTAGAWLQPFVSSSGVANFLGFLTVFLAVILAGSILSWAVSRLLRTVGLSWIDRVMGVGFGVARGMIVSVALVMIFVAFAPGSTASTPPTAVVHSRLAPYVIGTSKVVTQFAPYELKDEFHKRYDQVKRAWDTSHVDLTSGK